MDKKNLMRIVDKIKEIPIADERGERRSKEEKKAGLINKVNTI